MVPKTEEDHSENMNYNDRLDGYGFGESESRDLREEYQRDPFYQKHRCVELGEGYRQSLNKPYSKDEYGMRNLYGPVDQYIFRYHHLITREHGPEAEYKDEEEIFDDDEEEDRQGKQKFCHESCKGV